MYITKQDFIKRMNSNGKNIVRIGRLEKRIRKLTLQRDHFKKLYEVLRTVLDMFPMYERRSNDIAAWRAEATRVKALETRCWEQEQLLIIMHKENANNQS